MTAQVLIWNGIDFLEVDAQEAKRLVEADRAQLLDGSVDGLSLKPFSELAGRPPTDEPPERPDEPPERPDEPPEKLASKAVQSHPQQQPVNTMNKNVLDAPMKPWQTYRKVVSDKYKIPLQRVTKADVEKYLQESK